MEAIKIKSDSKFKLINPDWGRDTPCIPTSVITPSGPNKITMREARKRIDDVRQYCIIKSPSFASIAASVRHTVLTPKSNMFNHVAFTNGYEVWYGGGFFRETTKAQAAIVIHEVLHVALRHPQRGLAMCKNTGHEFGGANFNPYIWNLAVDCVVNLATFSLDWVEPPRCGVVTFDDMVDSTLSEQWPAHKWSAEKLYTHFMREAQQGKNQTLQQLAKRLQDALDRIRGKTSSGGDDSNEQQQESDGSRSNAGGGADSADKEENQSNFDSDSLLGDVATTLSVLEDIIRQDTDRESRNWKSKVHRASAGDRPGGILRSAVFDVPNVDTPWQVVLRRYMTSHVLPKTEPHLYKPGRQMLAETAASRNSSLRVPFSPGIQLQRGVKKIAACIDTSGSISEEVLSHFCAELQSLRNRVGADLVVIPADCEAYDPITILRYESVLEKIKYQGGLRGGGGTDFRPAVDAAQKIEGVKLIVYLTDMMGNFPETCVVPLVWAATTDYGDPPVGKIVRIM